MSQSRAAPAVRSEIIPWCRRNGATGRVEAAASGSTMVGVGACTAIACWGTKDQAVEEGCRPSKKCPRFGPMHREAMAIACRMTGLVAMETR